MHGFGMFGFISIAMFTLFLLVPLALFIWALVDILKSEFKDSNNRIIWLLVVLLLPMIGAVIYLTVGRKQKAGVER
jgi:hypothetical protein